MKTHHVLTALGVAGVLAISAPVIADDGDVQHARILLEEAQSYGVTGMAAGQTAREVEEERAHRREAVPEVLTGNELRWAEIRESQSHN